MTARTIGFKLTEDETALLNGKLSTLGYDSLSNFVHSWMEGRITSRQMIGDLADSLIEKLAPAALELTKVNFGTLGVLDNSNNPKNQAQNTHLTWGCGVAWLAFHPWAVEVSGPNPLNPMLFTRSNPKRLFNLIAAT